MQSALSESVTAVTYCCNTSTFAALVPLLSQTSTPIVSLSATDDSLYPKPTENVYMIAPTAAQQAAAILAHIKTQLGGSLEGKKVAFLHIDVAYGDTMAATLKEDVEAEGGTYVAEEKFDFTATSFGSQAQLIADAKPDAVALMGTDAQTVAPVQALRTAGLTTQPIVGYSGGNSDIIFESLAAENFSAVRSSVLPTDTTELGQLAAELGYADDLGSTFPDGWDSADFIVQGLKQCGEDCDAAALNDVLNDIGEVTGSTETRYGPLESTPEDHTLTSVGQFFTWDPATASVVPDGEPVPFPFP